MFLVSHGCIAKSFLLIFSFTFYLGNADAQAEADAEPKFLASITKCRMSDEECQIEQANKFLRTRIDGNPAEGLPKMDPIIVDRVSILNDPQNPVYLDLELTDLRVYNASTTVVKGIKGFTNDTSKPMKLTVTAYSPLGIGQAKYKLNGRLLVLPIKGDGDLELRIFGLELKVLIKLRPEKRNGKIYMIVDDIKFINKPKNAHLSMTNLFGGDPVLSENILKVMNENWRVLHKELTPRIDVYLIAVWKKVLGKLLEGLPYENWFLS